MNDRGLNRRRLKTLVGILVVGKDFDTEYEKTLGASHVEEDRCQLVTKTGIVQANSGRDIAMQRSVYLQRKVFLVSHENPYSTDKLIQKNHMFCLVFWEISNAGAIQKMVWQISAIQRHHSPVQNVLPDAPGFRSSNRLIRPPTGIQIC